MMARVECGKSYLREELDPSISTPDPTSQIRAALKTSADETSWQGISGATLEVSSRWGSIVVSPSAWSNCLSEVALLFY